MKKIFALVLCTLLAVMPVCAGDLLIMSPPQQVTVSLRIEGMTENFGVWQELSVPVGATVADAVRSVLPAEDYTEVSGPYGTYFSSIRGEAEGLGNYGGWNYCVNNASPSVSMGACVLQGGEDIVVYYGDLDTLYPLVKVEAGVLSVTAKAWQPNETGEWVEVEQPIAGVTVQLNGQAAGMTDENGMMVLPEGTQPTDTVQLVKDGAAVEGGVMPKVVRLAADAFVAALAVPAAPVQVFADVPVEHPAFAAILALYNAGIVNGKGNGLFGPQDALTAAELLTMVYRMAGSPAVEGSNPAIWYHDAAVWAGAMGQMVLLQPNMPLSYGQLSELAAGMGIVWTLPEGVDAGAFMTRAEAAMLLVSVL